jgi:hypothetical protein
VDEDLDVYEGLCEVRSDRGNYCLADLSRRWLCDCAFCVDVSLYDSFEGSATNPPRGKFEPH